MDKVTGNLTDADAVSVADLFLPLAAGVDYSVGDRRRFRDALYKCAQAHTSQTGWEPDKAASLWAVAADPAEAWPVWSHPTGAHDAYSAGGQSEPQR